MKNKNIKEFLIPILVCIISIIIGLTSKNTLIGTLVLITGILNAYYGSIGNKINFPIGVINNLALSYVSFKNHNFGLVIFNLLLFMPINIKGYFEWDKNSINEKVENRGLGIKKGSITVIISILCGLLVAFLLELIPGERLSYLDSFTNVISFMAGILLMLRYYESWILYLVNNVLDLTLWFINFNEKGFDSFMVLLMSIVYLTINIYALLKWRKKDE